MGVIHPRPSVKQDGGFAATTLPSVLSTLAQIQCSHHDDEATIEEADMMIPIQPWLSQIQTIWRRCLWSGFARPDGRSGQQEFALLLLTYIPLWQGLTFFVFYGSDILRPLLPAGVFYILFYSLKLGLTPLSFPIFAVICRRLHDCNWSGW